MTRERTASPNDPARAEHTKAASPLPAEPCSPVGWSPSDPPRMVLNRRIHDVASAMSRAGIEAPGLPDLRNWNRCVSPLAVHLAAPALAAQGNDLAQGLLLFAETKPARADDCTGGWIAAHLAACFGFEPSDDGARVSWADSRADLWQRIAQDPLRHRAWTRAPRPWAALAAVIEFDAYLRHGDPAFPSRLPVTLTSLQLGGPRLGVTMMSDTAVFVSSAAAAAFGLSFVPFGPGLYATHAADAWMLSAAVADAFDQLGANAQLDRFWASRAALSQPTLTPPTLM